MSLTKIQPYSLDSANDFSSLVDSAYAHANSAFNTANNSTDTWVRTAANSSSSYANSAFIQANAAFNKANTGISSGFDPFLLMGG